MTMPYKDWLKLLEQYLEDLRPDVRVDDIDPNAMYQAHQQGTAPLAFAQQPIFPIKGQGMVTKSDRGSLGQVALDEYARQHRAASKAMGWGIGLLAAWPFIHILNGVNHLRGSEGPFETIITVAAALGSVVGLVMIILAVTRTAAIRQRVAEGGQDAGAWEQPLKPFRRRCVLIAVGVLVLLILFLLFQVWSVYHVDYSGLGSD